ncbi:tRNA pseudouridine(38-40) synthase TruA [Arthrobacter monumenti]
MTTHQPAVPQSGGGGLLRVKMRVAYDGGPFSGWAIQPGRITVQGVLEEGLATLIRRPVRATVAGRTDAGVHARGQVVHFDLSPDEWYGLSRGKDLEPGEALQRRLRGVMNKILHIGFSGADVRTDSLAADSSVNAIQVHDAVLAPAGFDARFSALWRRYSYRIADDAGSWDPLTRHLTLWYKDALDIDVMNNAAKALLGLQDFKAFCKPREGRTTIRELQRFEFVRNDDGVIVATVQADAFCHNMVRCLIGAALLVGSGDRSAEWLSERLLARKRDAQAKMSPAHPLVFEEVGYPGDAEMLSRAESTRARRVLP